MNPDEKTIRSLVETWFRATTAGDLSTVLGLMSDDVDANMVAPAQPSAR
jgi:ketosteroid isomerase-like protein